MVKGTLLSHPHHHMTDHSEESSSILTALGQAHSYLCQQGWLYYDALLMCSACSPECCLRWKAVSPAPITSEPALPLASGIEGQRVGVGEAIFPCPCHHLADEKQGQISHTCVLGPAHLCTCQQGQLPCAVQTRHRSCFPEWKSW